MLGEVGHYGRGDDGWMVRVPRHLQVQSLEAVQGALREFSKAEAAIAQAAAPIDGGASIGLWPCDICGSTHSSATALGCHRSRAHGIRRWTRRYVLSPECPVCLRRFQNRTRLLMHLHDDSEVCLVNLRIFGQEHADEEIEAADCAQSRGERKAQDKGEHRAHSDDFVMQACGPLRRLVIPLGHSRKSASALMRTHLKCRVSSRCVDFGHLRKRLGIDPEEESESEAEDDLPMDVLDRIWSG